MKDVLVVDPAADWYCERLAGDGARLHAAPTFADAGPYLAGAQAVVTMGIPAMGLHLDRGVVDRMPRLEWVQCLLAGHEHVAAALAGRPDVVLTTARGIHGPQMAETVLLHMLVLARRVRQQLENQAARRWRPWPQPLLAGRTAVVVGLGSSGTRIARTCTALGMTVVGVSRTVRPVEGVDRVVPRGRLLDAAAEADFLVIVVAGDEETRGLVDAAVLRAMKPTAFLVNVARGSVVDEEALVEALRDGEIAGAGLDVFATEPLPPESPLWHLPNVFVTPHVAGRSDRYAEQALAVVQPNLRRFLAGSLDELVNVVAR